MIGGGGVRGAMGIGTDAVGRGPAAGAIGASRVGRGAEGGATSTGEAIRARAAGGAAGGFTTGVLATGLATGGATTGVFATVGATTGGATTGGATTGGAGTLVGGAGTLVGGAGTWSAGPGRWSAGRDVGRRGHSGCRTAPNGRAFGGGRGRRRTGLDGVLRHGCPHLRVAPVTLDHVGHVVLSEAMRHHIERPSPGTMTPARIPGYPQGRRRNLGKSVDDGNAGRPAVEGADRGRGMPRCPTRAVSGRRVFALRPPDALIGYPRAHRRNPNWAEPCRDRRDFRPSALHSSRLSPSGEAPRVTVVALRPTSPHAARVTYAPDGHPYGDH